MPVYKVEICGVNTSKLPLLSNEEKEELFRRILKGDREAREGAHAHRVDEHILRALDVEETDIDAKADEPIRPLNLM